MSAQHTEPMLNIGEMSEILGFNVTEAFLAKLSFVRFAIFSTCVIFNILK